MTFVLRHVSLALLAGIAAIAFSGCLSDDLAAKDAYCKENPYATPCPLGQASDNDAGTTTIEIRPVP